MPKQKTPLPPEIAKWLASDEPLWREKAEAALRAAEADTNDLLFEQVEKEQRNAAMILLITIGMAQVPVQIATRGSWPSGISRLCLGVLVAAPFLYLGVRFLALPAGNRNVATILAFARRGDVRAVPFLLSFWQPRRNNEKSFATDAALLAVLQKAAPGTVSFSRDRSAKDPFAVLRTQFNALLVKRNGDFGFRSAAIATPEKVQIWLALLSHPNADSSAKSRILLQRIANARGLTLDEEVLQNAARTLLYGAPEKATEQTVYIPAAVSAPTEAWKPAETNAPTRLQRLGRR